MIYKRDFLGWLALALLFCGTALAYYYYFVEPRTLRIAAPPPETQTTQFLQGMASVFRKDGAHIRLTVLSYATNEEIVAAFEAGRADLAAVRADRALPSSAVGVAELGRIITIVLARPGTGIEKFADLQSRNVAELTRSANGEGVFRELVQLNHLDRQAFRPRIVSSLSAIIPATATGRPDAVLLAVPRGSTSIVEQMRAVEQAFGARPVFVPLGEAAALAKINSVFAAEDISEGELGSSPSTPATAVPTVTFPMLLVAPRKQNAAIIQELTAQMFDVRSSLMVQYPGAARLARLNTERGRSIPVHPGAATYYDASESSLLDRYSDVLWLLLFGFSTIVSAGVWLLRRLFPSEQASLRAEHAELLKIMRDVRGSADAAALAQAEQRIDDVVARVSTLALDAKLDPAQKSAFDITIAHIEKIIEGKRQGPG